MDKTVFDSLKDLEDNLELMAEDDVAALHIMNEMVYRDSLQGAFDICLMDDKGIRGKLIPRFFNLCCSQDYQVMSVILEASMRSIITDDDLWDLINDGSLFVVTEELTKKIWEHKNGRG